MPRLRPAPTSSLGTGRITRCRSRSIAASRSSTGSGSFSFHTGHGGRRHGDWVGMLARCEIARDTVTEARFRFLRHNAENETVLCALADEGVTFGRLAERSARLGATLTAEGDWVRVGL